VAYLGNAPDRVFVETIKDQFSGDDSTTAFTLSLAAQANTLEVLVENVQQEPTIAYTVSGTTLTFDSAPPSGSDNIYVIHRDPAVAKISVGNADLEDNSVTNAKLANDSVSFAEITLTSFNGIIQSTGGGGLYIAGDSDIFLTSRDFTSTYADFVNGGAVKLYNNNNLKFETTDSGARVYGSILADTSTISGGILADSATITRNITVGGSISADSATINGNIAISGKATATIATLTDSSTITPDFEANQNFTVTLAGNRTMANPLNIEVGQTGSIFLVQDSTGSRTLSFGSHWDFIGGTAPTLTTTAEAVDRLDYIVRTSTSIHTVFTADYS